MTLVALPHGMQGLRLLMVLGLCEYHYHGGCGTQLRVSNTIKAFNTITIYAAPRSESKTARNQHVDAGC